MVISIGYLQEFITHVSHFFSYFLPFFSLLLPFVHSNNKYFQTVFHPSQSNSTFNISVHIQEEIISDERMVLLQNAGNEENVIKEI